MAATRTRAVGDEEAPLPRITLVTPSYQQATFLEATIRSVVDQRYPDLEYLVYDGGSTDGSVDIIRAHEADIDYWQSEPDGGQSAAINAGWERATGDILGWLNSDDQLAPGALLTVGRLFAAHPEFESMYGRMDLIDQTGRLLGTIGEPFSRRGMILSRNMVPQPSAFVRRSAVQRVGLLDPSLRYVMDLDLWLRLADERPPHAIPDTLARAVVHDATKTFAGRDAMAAERLAVRLRYARGPERIVVRLQPVASAIYHRLPSAARDRIDHFRPPRARADRLEDGVARR